MADLVVFHVMIIFILTVEGAVHMVHNDNAGFPGDTPVVADEGEQYSMYHEYSYVEPMTNEKLYISSTLAMGKDNEMNFVRSSVIMEIIQTSRVWRFSLFAHREVLRGRGEIVYASESEIIVQTANHVVFYHPHDAVHDAYIFFVFVCAVIGGVTIRQMLKLTNNYWISSTLAGLVTICVSLIAWPLLPGQKDLSSLRIAPLKNPSHSTPAHCTILHSNTPPYLQSVWSVLLSNSATSHNMQQEYGDFAFLSCQTATNGYFQERNIAYPRFEITNDAEVDQSMITVAITPKECVWYAENLHQVCRKQVKACDVDNPPQFLSLFFRPEGTFILSSGKMTWYHRVKEHHFGGFFGACRGHSGAKCYRHHVADFSDDQQAHYHGILVIGDVGQYGNICMSVNHPRFKAAYRNLVQTRFN